MKWCENLISLSNCYHQCRVSASVSELGEQQWDILGSGLAAELSPEQVLKCKVKERHESCTGETPSIAQSMQRSDCSMYRQKRVTLGMFTLPFFFRSDAYFQNYSTSHLDHSLCFGITPLSNPEPSFWMKGNWSMCFGTAPNALLTSS